MTKDYINRQLSLLTDFISDYENGRISLNRFIMRVDAILALDGMAGACEALGKKVSTLEDMNAGVFEGTPLDKDDLITIKKIISEMAVYIKNSMTEGSQQ